MTTNSREGVRPVAAPPVEVEQEPYLPPRLIPLGNLQDALAGVGSLPTDGPAQEPGMG